MAGTYVASSTPDCALNVVRAGSRDRPLVILIHAVGTDLTYWGPQIEALGAEYDVVAFDLRGHGASSCGARYGFETLANDLAAVVRQAENGAAHLVGLSVGGMIAQVLATIEPALVRSLVLVDTVATFTDVVRTALRARAQTTRFAGMGAILQPTLDRWFSLDFAQRRPDMLDRVAKTLLAADKHVHAAMWETIATLDIEPALDAVTIPTLVLVGELDQTTPVASSQLIASRIAGAALTVIPGVSHLSPVEAPALVNVEIKQFLSRL